MGTFRFNHFEVRNERSAMKVNTDGVLLGAAATLQESDLRYLDIGTGTGTIALMLAQRSPSARIDAIDIDAPSAEEAAGNFSASPWPERLRALHTSLQEFRPEGLYDLIVSNPPYFDNSLLNPDGRTSTARHSLTLSYREIAEFAAGALAPSGRLSLILPADCEKTLCRTLRSFGLHPFRILRIRSSERKAPSRIIVESSLLRTDSPAEGELLISKGGKYSEEYLSLTRDFYLFS